MGNTLAPLDIRKTKKFDAFLAKYPKLLNKELLSDDKLFKTYSFLVEGESHIIMKVYLKRNNVSLQEYEASLPVVQRSFNLNIYPNLLPYTKLVNEPDFAALIRPKAHMTLMDRLRSVPILTHSEKQWIIFQLVTAVYNLHSLNLYHGALSSSNTLLTTWNHLFIADFAWYAPNYIYEDKLEDINFYFHSSKCNLAPEKLIPKESKDISSLQWAQENMTKVPPGTLKSLQKMDIFSLGCIIAEIMLDGTSLFTYEQLLSYRRDEYSPQDKIERIEDEEIRVLIQDMVQKDPVSRKDIAAILALFGKMVPESFYKLIYYINASFISTNFVLPDQRIALIRELLEPIYAEIIGKPLIAHYQPLPVPIQRFGVLENFLRHYNMIKPDFYELFKVMKPEFFSRIPAKHLAYMENNTKKELSQLLGGLDLKKEEVSKVNKESNGSQNDLILVALMICSNIRNVRFYSSVLVGLEMLQNFSHFFNDHVNLHIIIPYLFSLLDEQNPLIVIAAFNTACSILSGMKKPLRTKSDRRLFEDYILPNLLKAFQLQDPDVGRTFIERLADMVEIAVVFVTEGLKLEHNARVKETPDDLIEEISMGQEEEEKLEGGSIPATSQEIDNEISREVEKVKLLFIDYVQEIIGSPYPEMHEALRDHLAKLASALGPDITENCLFPYVISALNDPESKLQSLQQLEKMMHILSEKTVNGLLKPVLEKCIHDANEVVVLQSIKSVVEAVKLGKLGFDPLFIVKNFLPLVIHPNAWIREHAVGLVLHAVKGSDMVNLYANLQPAIRKYLKNPEEITYINESLVETMLIDPIPRRLFEEMRDKKNLQSLKDDQYRELIEILVDWFRLNAGSYIEEKGSAGIKEVGMDLDPAYIRNLQDVLKDFYEQTNSRHIKELTTKKNNKKLAGCILAEEDKGYQIQQDTGKGHEEHIGNVSQLRELRECLGFWICELLMKHEIPFVTYVKNVHNFCIFSDSLLEKVGQLRKKKDKELGSYERYERIVHISKTWEPNGFLVKTIYEHQDAVNCLEASPSARVFASAGDDQEIKIFDIAKIESDFTCTSICTLSASDEEKKEGERIARIKALKFLDEDLLVFGTNTGVLEVHQLQDIEKQGKGKGTRRNCIRKMEVGGQVNGIQTLTLGNNVKEKAFMYVTHSGELGIQEMNQKEVSLKFDIGKQRGMISTMLMSALDYTVVLGTTHGYILLYDIRANLLSGIYQLEKEAPILSLANYHPLKPGSLNAQDTLIGVSFGSDYHEVGFWNFNQFSGKLKSPDIYIYSSPAFGHQMPAISLKEASKSEASFNASFRSTFQHQMTYRDWNTKPLINNVLSYFNEGSDQTTQYLKEKMASGFSTPKWGNSVYKIVSTPNFSPVQLRHSGSWSRDLNNVVLTAGNDMNIRYWNMTNQKQYHIYNADGKRRVCKMSIKDNSMLCHESPIYMGQGSLASSLIDDKKNLLIQAGHRDRINDLLVLEKSELIVTCSRDKTIKIWK